MKRFFIIVALLCLIQFEVFPQLSFNVYCPEYILQPDGAPKGIRSQSWQDWCLSQIRAGQFGNPKNRRAWAAYSDRADNETSNFSRLDLGQKVYIADIKDGKAHIFSTMYVPNYPNIPNDAKDLGWISINNLLLWEECPRTRSQIYQKGLVVQDVSKSLEADMNPPYLSAPSLSASETGFRARSLDILFIMKSAIMDGKTFYLLSREYRCNNSDFIYGWLSEDFVTQWDQRLCLEPTSASAAVNYYKSSQLYPVTFYQEEDAQLFYRNKQINRKFAYFDLTTKYLDANNMRLPILNVTSSNSDIFHSAVIQQSIEDGVRKKELEELKESLKRINIIFVIDHTSSMRGYFSVVSRAVQDLIKREYGDDQTQLYVGVVLYKDYADAQTVKVHDLDYDLPRVARFLNDAESNPKSEDSDYEEAMFEGLRTALDTNVMHYDKMQSNFIILLGDAGDHDSHNGMSWNESADEIARQMNENNIHFLGYQVNHDGSNAGTAWGLQVARIQTHFTKYFNQTTKNNYSYNIVQNKWWELRKDNKEAQYVRLATYKYVDKGVKLSNIGLKELVVKKIDNFVADVRHRIALLERGPQAGDLKTGGVNINEEDLRALLRTYDWSETKINEHLAKARADKFLAYVPSKISGSKYKLFDYVLFFSQDELDKISRELNRINDPMVISKKESFQNAVIQMGVSMLGQDPSVIQTMKVNDLMGQIFGVPIKLSTGGFSIDKIPYMQNEELERYIDDFKHKINNMDRIRQGSSKYRFKSNGYTYYWYPFSEVPGFVAE